MAHSTSRIAGFYQLSPQERLAKVAEIAGLDEAGVAHFANMGNIGPETADSMIENVIGTLNIPLGIATNLIIDGEEELVPMATEKSSVLAAVCHASRQCRESGGFTTSASTPVLLAQVQLVDVPNPEFARIKLLVAREETRQICDATDPVLLK